ncbi:MAG: hypothetical protein ABIE75_00820 [Candidatus Omnitrophota bacterium]
MVKTRKAPLVENKGRLLGLSIVSLSGFGVCQMADKKTSATVLAKRKTSKR